MNISLDEHKHILTYLDGSKQQESESSPGKGGDFSSEVTVKVRWNFGLVQKHQVRQLIIDLKSKIDDFRLKGSNKFK